MPIRILAPEVVSKIAAGEMVERPASVVKELVENSLDASASQISIEVRGSGINLIKVTDNGTGIPADEAELAFHRHATSKITDLAGLENSLSLGFRGEALPSIAQVAHVELLTHSANEDAGTYLSVQDGKIKERGIRACPRGTTVTVHGLFRNLPARLKFLKSPATENSRITDLVSQYSLAFPGVRFSLVIDERKILHTPGSGKQRDTLVEIYGLDIAQDMLEIGKNSKVDSFTPSVTGYVSPPAISRSNRSYLSFFVNRRWIQSLLLTRAVEKAYGGLLMTGRYPIAIINVSLPPQWLDVNVHPTKREARFLQESVVFNTIYGVVRRALTEEKPVPEIKARATPTPSVEQQIPLYQREETKPGSLPLIRETTPPRVPILRVLGQLSNAYIIAEGSDGLYLIDQHAAHERILFEEILAQREEKNLEIQMLLEPLTIELSARQEELMQSRGGILAQFGFSVEPFGGRTWLVRAIPAILRGKAIPEAVKEAIDSLEDDAASARSSEKIASSLACHSAIRAGKLLTHEEMRELIQQLEKATSPRTCPHGRPTMIHLSSGRLEKEFGRS